MTSISAHERDSLYAVLDSPAPTAHGDGPGGETMITATKETLDNDAEETSDDDILQL